MQTDKYGQHEVLHMASFVQRVVDEELVGHGAIKANPEWLVLAERASEVLVQLYQSIGNKTL